MILGADGNPLRPKLPTRRVVQARYDLAQTTPENARHWAGADGLSARAANSAEVRYRMRTRARYERDNAPYAQGMVLTLANDTIGTGPRLQMLTDDDATNRRIEESFLAWSEAVGLPEKLRTSKQAKTVDGEAFGLLTSNGRINHPVQLDIRLIEADQITTPDLEPNDPSAVDGIRFDEDGNPVEYHILENHPGDAIATPWNYRKVPARAVIHWFRCDRPGQARGIPEITPAASLFAQLRLYREAVLGAARSAASFAGTVQTTAPPNGEAADIDQSDGPLTLEIEPGMLTTLPEGWTLSQLKPEQPSTNYEMFVKAILNEIARCLNMPFNVAAGNSEGYNYASGRLDHKVYYKSLRVEQRHLESVVLDRIFAAWLDEAAMVVPGLVPDGPGRLAGWPHKWFWDGDEHVDPQKEASAQETRLRNHTTTLAEEYARRGRDWETELRQRAREAALMKELGLAATPAEGSGSAPVTPGGSDADEDE